MWIIGIDTGGTFTDLVAFNSQTGRIFSVKTLTTSGDESKGIISSIQETIPKTPSIDRIVHGTTIGTNSILERRGAKTAILTTRGFRDLLEIGRTRRMVSNTLFDLSFQKPTPLVPRSLRFDVDERVMASGEILEPLDQNSIRETAKLLRDKNVNAVAICFLHSYANSEHELSARDILKELLPDVYVSVSSEIVPEYREFERLTTTVLNAFIGPTLDSYLSRLERDISQRDSSTRLFIMSSNGGMATVNRMRTMPVSTVLSGPAGGVIAGIDLAETINLKNIITCDMGGTSTDVCLIRDSESIITVDNVVAGMPLKSPQIDMKTVGAGGGSIATVSAEGQIHVGPMSAGANPGPICYGLGGTEITVTDANLFLGRLSLHKRLGGRISPVTDQVKPSLDKLATASSVNSSYEMAAGIIKIAVAKMVSSILEISVMRGYDPRECTLVPFGGAGPMHGTMIADELGITNIVIPRYPGHFSAWGLLISDVRQDAAETILAPVDQTYISQICSSLDRLENKLLKQLVGDGFPTSTISFKASLDLRYKGQAFEIPLPVDQNNITYETITNDFNKLYAKRYGHANEGQVIEIVNTRLTGVAKIPKPSLTKVQNFSSNPIDERDVYFNQKEEKVPVYARDTLPINADYEGPAIIEEDGATTVVFPHWVFRRDDEDKLYLTKSEFN